MTEPLRILADQIALMHWGLVREAIDRCANATVVARDVPANQLDHAIRTLSPDVLILGASDTLQTPSILEDWMQSERPTRRIIALFDDPAQIELREWRIEVDTLHDLSLDKLCAAIEGRR